MCVGVRFCLSMISFPYSDPIFHGYIDDNNGLENCIQTHFVRLSKTLHWCTLLHVYTNTRVAIFCFKPIQGYVALFSGLRKQRSILYRIKHKRPQLKKMVDKYFWRASQIVWTLTCFHQISRYAYQYSVERPHLWLNENIFLFQSKILFRSIW